MPKEFLSPAFVSDAFFDYMKPLLPAAPNYLRLY
jgi:hypothetical protein